MSGSILGSEAHIEQNKDGCSQGVYLHSQENDNLTILSLIYPCPSPLAIPMLWKIVVIILHHNDLLLKLPYVKSNGPSSDITVFPQSPALS